MILSLCALSRFVYVYSSVAYYMLSNVFQSAAKTWKTLENWIETYIVRRKCLIKSEKISRICVYMMGAYGVLLALSSVVLVVLARPYNDGMCVDIWSLFCFSDNDRKESIHIKLQTFQVQGLKINHKCSQIFKYHKLVFSDWLFLKLFLVYT